MVRGSFSKRPAILVSGLLLAHAPAPMFLTDAVAMTAAGGKAVEVNAFLDLTAYDDVPRRIPAPPSATSDADSSTTAQQRERTMSQQHPYVGMWVTADGRIRQELLPNGRYDEARGSRKSAYQGRYEVRGNHIDYWDDTGFTAVGTFLSDDELHHGGMIFRREK